MFIRNCFDPDAGRKDKPVNFDKVINRTVNEPKFFLIRLIFFNILEPNISYNLLKYIIGNYLIG
jgi:hypothetical protein